MGGGHRSAVNIFWHQSTFYYIDIIYVHISFCLIVVVMTYVLNYESNK